MFNTVIMKITVLSVLLLLISGCSTTPHALLNPPPRPMFYQYGEILWQQIPIQAQDAISSDDLACKRYMDRTESRIAIHNGDD